VQIGDVQDADRRLAGGQHRHIEAAQREQIALD
jgi:hypothetical protein